MENCIPHRFWAQAENRGTRITTGSWGNKTFYTLSVIAQRSCCVQPHTVKCRLFTSHSIVKVVADILIDVASKYLAVMSKCHLSYTVAFPIWQNLYNKEAHYVQIQTVWSYNLLEAIPTRKTTLNIFLLSKLIWHQEIFFQSGCQ